MGECSENVGRAGALVEVSFQVESPSRLSIVCFLLGIPWVPKEISFAALTISCNLPRAKELRLDSGC